MANSGGLLFIPEFHFVCWLFEINIRQIDKYFRNLFFSRLNERFQFFCSTLRVAMHLKNTISIFRSVCRRKFIHNMSDVIDSFTENCWLTLGKHEIQFWKCLQFTFSFDSRDPFRSIPLAFCSLLPKQLKGYSKLQWNCTRKFWTVSHNLYP